MEIEYTIFYCDYANNESIDSQDPMVYEMKDILVKMQDVLANDENFFGITDDQGITIQFCRNKDGSIWSEIPFPSKNGSYGKNLTLDEAYDMVSKLNGDIELEKYNFFEFQSWYNDEPIEEEIEIISEPEKEINKNKTINKKWWEFWK